MNIESQPTQTSTITLTKEQLALVQGGNLEAEQPNQFDEPTLQYQPWRDDQHINSITSSKHTGNASKFNAMN